MAAPVPEWKQALLKQKQAKEESLKEPSVEEKYAGLPAWKRDLLIKKEEDAKKLQDLEKPKVIFGSRPSSTSTDVFPRQGSTGGSSSTDAAARKLSFTSSKPASAKSLGRADSIESPTSPQKAQPAEQSSPAAGTIRSRVAVFSASTPTAKSQTSSSSSQPLQDSLTEVQAVIQRLKLAAETKAEQELREKQIRRRSMDGASSPHAILPHTPRSHSLPALKEPASPGILLTPDKRKKKVLTRKISFADASSKPLEEFGPTAYYSDSEEEAPSAPQTASKEDEEEISGLALRIHKSVNDRHKQAQKSSATAAQSSRYNDDDDAPIVLEEADATMVW